MRKYLILFTVVAFLIYLSPACDMPTGAKYAIHGKDNEDFNTTFYAADTAMNNGCVSFVDLQGRGDITLCGTFSVNKVK